MYNPSHFVEDRIEVLYSFIRQNPLATIVTCGENGPEATHAPVVLHAETPGALLRCHFARVNGHWEKFQSSPAALAIFHGPDHYITPSWYPSKQEHGKVVPTWNYVAVHVKGRAKIFDDPTKLLSHLRALTDQNEHPRETPWSVDDAPRQYIEALAKAVVGIEIAIDSVEGKWKVSQNRPAIDRQGVIEGLRGIHSPESAEMARLVEERSRK